jgi:ascorbate-specific PTS system EIIC-type component UlaA
MITIPDFLTFLANNTIIALLALVAWIFVVAAVVWLGEKAVKKFRQRLSRTATQADASVSSVATRAPASRPVPGASREWSRRQQNDHDTVPHL